MLINDIDYIQSQVAIIESVDNGSTEYDRRVIVGYRPLRIATLATHYSGSNPDSPHKRLDRAISRGKAVAIIYLRNSLAEAAASAQATLARLSLDIGSTNAAFTKDLPLLSFSTNPPARQLVCVTLEILYIMPSVGMRRLTSAFKVRPRHCQ